MAREIKRESTSCSPGNGPQASRSMVSKYFGGIKEEAKGQVKKESKDGVKEKMKGGAEKGVKEELNELKSAPSLELNDERSSESTGTVPETAVHPGQVGPVGDAAIGTSRKRRVSEEIFDEVPDSIASASLNRSRSTSGMHVIEYEP